ncbi:MAG: polysaccharide biosynthesis protein [Calditrichaeota bacterium]|nr:polysaccharide biosynthesis protein [Calditrichota bacterium]
MAQKFFALLKSRGIVQTFFKISIDALVIGLAYIIAYSLRFDLSIPANNFLLFKHTLGMAVIIELLFINILGVNQSQWQFTSIQDIINLFLALLVGWIGFIIYLYFGNLLSVPRSVLFFFLILSFIFTGAVRFVPRIMFKMQSRLASNKKRVAVIGAGKAGEMIIRQMKNDPSLGFYPLALIDDSPKKQNTKIHGVKVLGTTSNLKKIVAQKHIDEIIIATPSASAGQMRRIVQLCEQTGIDFKTVPGPKEIVNGLVQVQQIRDVKVEDLLDRAPIEIDYKEIRQYLEEKTILVTGAAGSIGSELVLQLLSLNPHKVICLDRSENSLFYLDNDLKQNHSEDAYQIIVADILDLHKMDHLLSTLKPDIVFHAAAYKHVPLMEFHPEEAVRNNILGTAYLVQLAEKHDVNKFVLISTDKAVNPTSIMGATKRVAELVLQSYSAQSNMKLVTVRFGNVLASYGSVIPLFQKQIASGGPITITHPEMKRFFMTIPEAVKLIFQATRMSNGNDIFVLDMGEPIKILDIAYRLIKLSGLRPEKDISIKYIGLRPGEKLFEELWNNDEVPLKTAHPKIMKAIGSHYNNWDRMESHLKEYEEFIQTHDIPAIYNKLHEMIPEFSGQFKKQLEKKTTIIHNIGMES